MSDELTPQEERLLHEVPVVGAPAGFAARVLAEQQRRQHATRRRVALAAAAAAAVVVVTSTWLWPRAESAQSGQLAAAPSRTTVTLASRGVAVAEAGAALTWAVASDGAAKIAQSSGNVFYRVEPGGRFVVSTGAGEVTVTGTCFRVEVTDVKNLSSATIGAVVATVMTVTVYEGRVLATGTDHGPPKALAAGESATMASAAHALVPPATSPTAPSRPGHAPLPPASSHAPLPAHLSPEALYEAHAAVTREAEALRSEVQRLERELDAKSDKDEREKFYEPTPADLVELAQQCRLQWDTVSLSSTPPGYSVKNAEKLGLSEEERAAVEARVNAHQKALVDQIRALYVEITGDTTAGSLAATAMLDEIADKTTQEEHQRVFQQLARERAGLAQPPPPDQPESPYTRLFRALTGAGNALERSLAEELGPETARRIRDLDDGWGHKHGSSYGCPSP